MRCRTHTPFGPIRHPPGGGTAHSRRGTPTPTTGWRRAGGPLPGATPDTAGPARDALWTELLAAGVDHLTTDDPVGLKAFLDAHPSV
ncbi:hypothetical protein D9753_30990 [Streptomyces dangxiongensis]|uniref:GP-PDE domain-containing protein n=1 Tax=Streptomyces dangxiongensis TaxID=1442032 RepID=A0A3G2JPK2_9ACTN|nr:hypothetical protein D9753_30990 [Streptomyces dangxiongensis]